ncbi:MAG: terminase TerL endonuclease subunit [Deltaproteobacteria bacterium]
MPFCEEKADRVKRFIETYCTFSKGEWAGKPFNLLPWQWDELIKPLFGTVNGDGFRQYRTCYTEIPKKNGKSELCAALGLYMLTNDKEDGAEVYLAAADREQASIVYQAAATMVSNNPELSKHIKRLDSRKRLVYAKKNSFLQVLSSESYTKHGLSPSCVIVDEIHAHPNGELYEILTAGSDYGRRQQVVLIITTAGIYDRNSIWWKLRTRAQQVKAGIIEDPRFLPVLYLADEKDDPTDEALWQRVNPSIGQIFSMDKIRQDYEEAKNDPVDYQNFLRFRLNIPIKSLSRWMPMDRWDSCADPVDLDSLKGRKCYGGLDLASKIDLAAFLLVFPPLEDGGTWDIVAKFYCPSEGILKRSRVDKVNYHIWEKQGFITATPGDCIDYAFIEEDIFRAAKDYDLREIGFDSWNATSTANRIMEMLNPTNADNGFRMMEIRQGARSFNEPAKDLLVKVMNKQIRHGGQPVLRWCFDNLVMRSDPNGNVAPDKQRATEKIDGAVSLIMAMAGALRQTKEIIPTISWI